MTQAAAQKRGWGTVQPHRQLPRELGPASPTPPDQPGWGPQFFLVSSPLPVQPLFRKAYLR